MTRADVKDHKKGSFVRNDPLDLVLKREASTLTVASSFYFEYDFTSRSRWEIEDISPSKFNTRVRT
mgnify:CR=1 FL=1